MMIAVIPSSRRQSCVRKARLSRSINAFNNIGGEVRMLAHQPSVRRVEKCSRQPRLAADHAADVADTRSLSQLCGSDSEPLGEHIINLYQTATRPSRTVIPSPRRHLANWASYPAISQQWERASSGKSVIVTPAVRPVGKP
jgi:hypothetical protein